MQCLTLPSNVISWVECVGVGSFCPVIGSGNSRHPHDKSDVKLKLATALPPAFSPRFRQFISVYFGFSLVLSHFHFFSIRSGNFFVITQSKSDHKKDPLNTSHC